MFHVESLTGNVLAAFPTERDAVTAMLKTQGEGDQTRWARIQPCDDPTCVWCRAAIQMLRRAVYAMVAHNALIAWPVCADCSTGDLQFGDTHITRHEIVLLEHHRAENCDACGIEIVATPGIIGFSDTIPPGNRWVWVDADLTENP